MDREGRTYGPSSTAINKAGTIISIRKDIFDIVVALVCWSIWKERNARIFEHRMRTPEHLVDDVEEETLVWKTAGVIKPCNNENH
ncbi:Os02g0155201 [Oryza sativa Japonica Group]|uniref:Os02g0155201 protein n=1 Tax=Oryza sativa subsp. japonica TaxID=39947 RepID=A0A0P0VEX3_ORYSJ|nr:Os02g0155201 [Oryza sativa Japonica Group]